MYLANYIETLRREKEQYLTEEYANFYSDFNYNDLDLVLSTLHSELLDAFKRLNLRLPTESNGAYFRADDSRNLINIIDNIKTLQRKAANTEYAFEIEKEYQSLIDICDSFLSSAYGSNIPPNMSKIDLYYKQPVFKKSNNIKIGKNSTDKVVKLQLIGEGSYAFVYQFYDPFYDKTIILKRAKKDLDKKELQRFKEEFESMKILNSPYIVEVFKYDDEKKEYTMEFMDHTLYDYILNKKNNDLNVNERKSIVFQILKAFDYIISKGLLHRDISPKNILIKTYEDTNVVKIADFGLVKTPNSDLTSVNTELKGCFNDPNLRLDGFKNYSIIHETYALTLLIFFIMTGKTNTTNISNEPLKNFVLRGLSADHSLRYKSIKELELAFKQL